MQGRPALSWDATAPCGIRLPLTAIQSRSISTTSPRRAPAIFLTGSALPTRTGPLIASDETLPRDVKGQAGSDQIAALHLRRNHATDASLGGTVGAGNPQSEGIADCELDREKETEPGEKSKRPESSLQTPQGKPPAKRAETR